MQMKKYKFGQKHVEIDMQSFLLKLLILNLDVFKTDAHGPVRELVPDDVQEAVSLVAVRELRDGPDLPQVRAKAVVTLPEGTNNLCYIHPSIYLLSIFCLAY